MKYDPETRDAALAALRETGAVALVARAHILTEQTLRNWAREAGLDISAIRRHNRDLARAKVFAFGSTGTMTSREIAEAVSHPHCPISESQVRRWIAEDGRYVGIRKAGRPPTTRAMMLSRLPEIEEWLRTRRSKRGLGRHLGVSRGSVERFLLTYLPERCGICQQPSQRENHAACATN